MWSNFQGQMGCWFQGPWHFVLSYYYLILLLFIIIKT